VRRRAGLVQLAAPCVLIVAVALLGTAVSASSEGYFVDTLVKVSIVVALYMFIGNSGVLSFGHISFVALGAWTAGVLSVPTAEKPAIMPNLAHFLRTTTVGNVPSLLLAALAGGVFALAVGLPLMRLSGLAAGIATFGVLEITHNMLRYYEKIGPGLNTFSSVPETTGLLQASIGALIAIDLHGDEMRVHNGSYFGIIIGLAVHYVAPMTPNCTDVEQHRLILAPCGFECLRAPFVPLNGLVHGRTQIG